MPEITFKEDSDFAIPDEFVLICNASSYGPINMMPIYHLGKGKIKKLVINCGVDIRINPTPQELHAAIIPARRLEAFALKTLKLQKSDILVVDNDPDAFLGWERGVAWAAAHNLPILCNFQGGTTQMSMGTLHALEASDANWMRLFVSKYPASVRIPVMAGGAYGEIAWPDDWVEERVPLDILLASLGYDLKQQETEHGGGISDQASRLYERFVTKVGRNQIDRNAALKAMNSLKRETQSPRDLSLQDRTLVAQWYGRSDHAIPWNNGHFTTIQQRDFYYGGWLERAIFDQVKLLLKHDPNFTVSLNFEVCVEGKPQTANEVDILIRHRDVFHLVEVKSSRTASYLNTAADKLIGINRILGGRPSRSWLCAPFVHFGDQSEHVAAQAEFTQRLDKKGITLLAGDGAVDQLHQQISELS